MLIIKSTALLLMLSILLSGCVTQMAIGVMSTAVSVPFQVAGQVVDSFSDDN